MTHVTLLLKNFPPIFSVSLKNLYSFWPAQRSSVHACISINLSYFEVLNIDAKNERNKRTSLLMYLRTFGSTYNEKLGSILNRLKVDAMVNSPRWFAKGSEQVTPFYTIYALVQCTIDLSPFDCKHCIETGINRSSGQKFAIFMSPVCYVTFDNYHLSNTTNSTLPWLAPFQGIILSSSSHIYYLYIV